MRVFILLLLTLSAVTETEAFLFDIIGGIWDTITGIFGTIFDWGITTFNKFVDTGFRFGSTVIGAVVDPFGWWTPTTDEHGHNTGKVAKCPARSDILFVFDTSGSIDSGEFDLAKKFANRLSEHFQISDKDVRFAAITFGDRVQKVFDFRTYSKHEQLSFGLAQTPRVGGSTKTYLALEYILQQNLFSTSNGARDQSSKIVIVITDGSSDSLTRTNSAANALKQKFHVVSTGIGAGLGVELHNIASDWSNVFTADSYANLVRIEQRVARRLCEIPEADGNIPQTSEGSDACSKGFKKNPNKPGTCKDINECTEGGNKCEQNCVNIIGSFRCTCKGGYVIDPEDSSKCKSITVCTAPVDIIFVVDASGSIGTHKYKVQQNFVAKLVHHFKYGSNGAQFGALVFSTKVEKLFDLKTYVASRSECTKAINSAPYPAEGTNTQLALKFISDNELFSSRSGGRPNAKKFVILITDGPASNHGAAKAAADSLKAQDVHIVVVAVTENVDGEALTQYASNPKDVFGSIDFDLLDYIEESVAQTICSRAGY